MSADPQRYKSLLPEVAGGKGKKHCPFHEERTPSCEVNDDYFYCFGCGAHGDVIDWLKQVDGLSTSEAIRELERRAGGYVPPATERRPAPPRRIVVYKPVDEKVLEQHHRRAAQLDHVPAAMQGRGFTLDDLRRLQIAAYGPDAVLPITGPDGQALALKRRFAEPGDGPRYRYTTPGHGTPAWCSPDFAERDRVLVVEGELNGAACWLAAPELGVMGVAGTGGALHLDALKGRTVYVYADGDDPGQRARDKWAASALEAGALKVYVLDPWEADACDIAGKQGRAALGDRLTANLQDAQSFRALKAFDAPNTAPKDSRLPQHKPYLGFSGSRFSSKPKLGGKPCL